MKKTTIDGNAAAAHVSYAFSEVAAIYPITPSSPMAELADKWASEGKTNLFQTIPQVVEMQSESGAAGALHGSLTCGALSTTFTCSQGLLLMLPDMYKIAGELLPTVFQVSARALSTHALSIFGDHQDVMACRASGFAMLCASTVQEVADLSLAAHLTALKTSVPFLHFFDGFRTSHEVAKIELPEYEEMLSLVEDNDLLKFRARALNPDKPVQRGTAQNPDVYFQNREAANARYAALPQDLKEIFEKVSALTGRSYRPFDYYGDPKAERIVVAMGSALSTLEETADELNRRGEKIGVVKVRLYRPFSVKDFLDALPSSAQKIAVLDRTKEAGSLGEPLYLDVCAALKGSPLQIFGGRYGLGGKEFTPAHAYAVFENLKSSMPKNGFTVGIEDDKTHTSLSIDSNFAIETNGKEYKFYGLGSDGTVGANKSSIKIIGDNTQLFVQGYFQYDSKKSGGVTVSHLRTASSPIRSAYLVEHADFTACHNPSYLSRYDMLEGAKTGGVFLLNCPWKTLNELEKNLPEKVKCQIAEKALSLFVIDATSLAEESGLKGRTGTVMQAAFFLLNPSILPYEKAETLLKADVEKRFPRAAESNLQAIDGVKSRLQQIHYPSSWKVRSDENHRQKDESYYEQFIRPVLQLKGDSLPVSAFEEDGSVPTGTSRLENRGRPLTLPKWIPENCIQCNRCSFACPHAAIRPFATEEQTPDFLITLPAAGLTGARFRIQVFPQGCMSCGVCANTCPAKEKALVMTPAEELYEREEKNLAALQKLTPADTSKFKISTVKGSQFSQPLFEFSYACAGCGETNHITNLTRLFGERMVIANATGCSSIYGGSAPVCPYTKNKEGKGPAWASSLFEDNAEFALGMRLALNQTKQGKNKSVWGIGGDGWAYDIGYGGLDHVLASGENVNLLVLDSEVYSNTGGQMSKATPLGATARFAASGKYKKKKELGLMAMSYGYVYVAQVCIGGNMEQFLKAALEADEFDGPALLIAYSPCISHGVSMSKSMTEGRLAVESGYWQLYRFNPDLKKQGKNPFILDSKAPTRELDEFFAGENRFANMSDEQKAEAKENARRRYELFKKLAEGAV